MPETEALFRRIIDSAVTVEIGFQWTRLTLNTGKQGGDENDRFGRRCAWCPYDAIDVLLVSISGILSNALLVRFDAVLLEHRLNDIGDVPLLESSA